MEKTAQAFNGMQALPIFKQIGLLIGLSASIALGIYIVLWSQGEDYQPLGGNFSERDAAEVVDVLERANVQFKLDPRTGLILVLSDDLQKARMQVAKEGLSRDGNMGLEILDKETSLTTSQFIERTRYIRGLQGELERTISQIQQIKSARVHLAIPKQSSFIRHKKPPSASVFVDVLGGVKLNQSQVGAIVNLVASSVQGLSADKVSVIDQYGTLLSKKANGQMALASEQFEYKKQIEDLYSDRINDLLTPIIGEGRVQAKVSAEIDYTSQEKTFESFDPQKKAVRSEKTLNVNQSNLLSAVGIPGALSNVPPASPTAPATTAQDAVVEEGEAPPATGNVRQQATRNFELDRTIGHERKLPGKVVKLSVAVLVDDKISYGAGGKINKTPLSEEEVKKLEQLVKDTIGFDDSRGDKVTVINTSFVEPAPIEALPETAIYEQPWFMTAVKQGLAGLFLLIVVLVVIRPLMKNLTQISSFEKAQKQKELEMKHVEQMNMQSTTPGGNELNRMKNLIQEDPKRVAQVVKTMVTQHE